MKKRFRVLLISALLFCSGLCLGQVDQFEYRAPILQAKTGWNSLILPSEMLTKIKQNQSDVRIYRQDSRSGKAIEQPYILEILEAKNETIEVEFNIINPTYSRGVYSYTFELSNQEAVNNIHLEFGNQNFDWLVHLQGSMDQNEWSSITHNYRIVSLKNQRTEFKYTDLVIPESKFNFYRISFLSSKKPNLRSAVISKEIQSKSSYTRYPTLHKTIEENEDRKTTTINLDLGKEYQVSRIEIQCTSENDYYRPIKIEAAIDSFETGNGMKYRYTPLYSGTLNSINENVFSFLNRRFQKFKITVKNFDNPPLAFDEFIVKGPNYRLITRLDDTENLLLCYGNEKMGIPLYDITYFKDKIPEIMNEAMLGDITHYPNGSASEPLFKNKWWLWGILVLVITLLGGFTLKMLKEEKN